jgi:hypothetical protein
VEDYADRVVGCLITIAQFKKILWGVAHEYLPGFDVRQHPPEPDSESGFDMGNRSNG